MHNAILFDVEGEAAQVHGWRGNELRPYRMKDLTIQVNPESIFALVLEDAYYRGPVPRDKLCDSFYRQVGIDVPREIIILPVYGEGRLEAVFYGDGGTSGQIDGETDTYLMLSEIIALAMKMLSCKMQLHG